MAQDFISPPLQPIPSSLRKSQDPRIGHLISQNTPADYCIVGYPDDEGIRLNNGRPGAADGPLEIRKFLYKMTPSINSLGNKKIFDQGNINPALSLEEKHRVAQRQITNCLKSSSHFISFGGGHDFGYPDGAGFLDHCHNEKLAKPLVINFDAHLDVRPLDNGPSSGTPFFRLLEQYKNFDFAEVGIQSQCNSQAHYDWCIDKNVAIISYNEIRHSQESLLKTLTKKLSHWIDKKRPCFLSVDIDAFSSSHAPGCSQSWPTGLHPDEFFECFEHLISHLNVLGLGLYEVSPPLDEQGAPTAKLAALIAHRFIYRD